MLVTSQWQLALFPFGKEKDTKNKTCRGYGSFLLLLLLVVKFLFALLLTFDESRRIVWSRKSDEGDVIVAFMKTTNPTVVNSNCAPCCNELKARRLLVGVLVVVVVRWSTTNCQCGYVLNRFRLASLL